MRMRNLSSVKLEVLTGGVFKTPWTHPGPLPIEIRNPLNDRVEVQLFPKGTLVVRSGYMADGASGPTVDDATNRIPSVVHDIAYQMLRMGIAPPSLTRKSADKVFHVLLLRHGMNRVRAGYYYRMLRWFGGRAAKRTRALDEKYTLLEG